MNRRLKARLIEQFGSQAEALRLLGISEWRLSRIVRGWDRPQPEGMEALKRVFSGRISGESYGIDERVVSVG